MVDLDKTLWASPLSSRMLAQKTDLIDLTKALKWVIVYTDSQYAFASAHVHGAVYHERGLLTADRKTLKINQRF